MQFNLQQAIYIIHLYNTTNNNILQYFSIFYSLFTLAVNTFTQIK